MKTGTSLDYATDWSRKRLSIKQLTEW